MAVFFFSEEMEEGVSRETCLESVSLINADLKKKKEGKEKRKWKQEKCIIGNEYFPIEIFIKLYYFDEENNWRRL